MSLALALLAAAALGALVGCLTGLLPGLHVNTLAVLLVASAPAGAAALDAAGASPDDAPLLLAAGVLAITVSHTFVNIVPATYLGAPDEATALSVLPAHRLLLRGQGFRAVVLNAHASFAALVASLLLFAPVAWLLTGPPAAWPPLHRATPALLVLLVAFLLWREPGAVGPAAWSPRRRHGAARAAALGLFLAAGLYGLAAFRLPYDALLPLPPSPLLPALSGLFGAATLLEATADHARIPHQFLRLHDDGLSPRGAAAALGVGVAAGASMSLFPGLTNATATAVASSARRGNDQETLVSLGAVNTANAVFNLLVLYLLGRSRSGAVVAIEELLPIDPWRGPLPAPLAWFLFVALAAGAVSLVATLALGRLAARRIHRVPYRPLVAGVLAYVAVVVFCFSGVMGLIVFAVGAGLGLVPVRLGLQRTHLTGVLLLPVLVYFWT